MFTRLLQIGILTLGLLLAAGSYAAASRRPEHAIALIWLGAILGGGILGAWAGRGTDRRRRQLERDNAEAAAVLEITQMANAAVNLEATLDLVVLTLQRTLGGPACAVFLV